MGLPTHGSASPDGPAWRGSTPWRCRPTPPRVCAGSAAWWRPCLKKPREVDATVTHVAGGDPVVARLVTITGVGPVLGLTMRAEIGDISRFATPKHLASYAGVVPRVDASAGRAHYGRITKTGSPWLRWALVEAAMHGTRRSDHRGRWARRLAMRKGGLKARVALARTLCDEIWGVWPRSR